MNRPKLSRLDLVLDWLISSRPKIRELERLTQEQQVRIGHLEARVQDEAQRIHALHATTALSLREEALRIDYALGAADGILDQIDDFHKARATPEYQAAFTTTNPLVSVCVATANRPDLLVTRCLASLQQQTYRNLQIIVVGDNCIDETPERVAALKDDRISFFNMPERGPYPPPGKARWQVAGTYPVNKAMSLSEGLFITHLDDDDRAEPDRIELLVRAAQENKADLCYHPFHFEAPDGGWMIIGDGTFEHRQLTTGSIFYHRHLARWPWDPFAYRSHEPGDWNRLRKIAVLRPRLHFVNKPLTYHYYGSHREPFVAREGERFLY